ncbi:tRNA uridine-5-carboxymethylaminomethyl(34) synthesis GTPase MnmE [Mesomycoplasma moatsii]|uniref:tRNA uridine-5-carboxymethylaminomethyl(34) synthesis GTPase MnmE n=1 Tax=Mesomycoplasma moatsii TaxID=171287 RepID=UPI0003B415E7
MLDTIAAISSGYVNQAISIIRITGSDALDVIKQIFTGKIGKNKTIQYGFIKNLDGKIIDEVLVSFFIGSDNFVGETTIEINAHGGIVVTQQILDLILSLGVRKANHGEFTRRAFLNGKISLIKAEAINDLINAKTSKQQEIAINSFNKDKEEKINLFIKDLEYLIGLCEINIDYPEYDDIPILDNKEFNHKLKELIECLEKIVNISENNQVFIRPISIAIVGNPNAGKSSLMNAILNDDKSIVTNIPGTTRDIVESEIIFNNFILKFKDTAGIRESKDEIEKIGIEKAWKEIEISDVIVHVIDSTKGLNNFDFKIQEKAKNNIYLQLWNKMDLVKEQDEDKIYISSKDKKIDNFNKALTNLLINGESEKKSNLSFNQRQTSCLKKALHALKNGYKSINDNFTYDVVVIDLHEAWEALKEILGIVDKEELLDSIFSNFCLGK